MVGHSQESMTILGIDPGTRLTGYGVIQFHRHQSQLITAGVIKLDGSLPLSERLVTIYSKVESVIAGYQPQMVAVETAFYNKNIASTMKLGHARGVILLAAAQHQIPIIELSPREIKRSITGNGNASKEQVSLMIQRMLNLTEAPEELDESDALAIALTAGFDAGPNSSPFKRTTQRMTKNTRSSWANFVNKNETRVVKS